MGLGDTKLEKEVAKTVMTTTKAEEEAKANVVESKPADRVEIVNESASANVSVGEGANLCKNGRVKFGGNCGVGEAENE